MPHDGPSQAKRNDRHDDERLKVGTEGDGQHRVDRKQDEHGSQPHTAEGFTLFSSLSFESELHAREGADDLRHEAHDVGLDDLKIHLFLVCISGNLNGAITIDAANA